MLWVYNEDITYSTPLASSRNKGRIVLTFSRNELQETRLVNNSSDPRLGGVERQGGRIIYRVSRVGTPFQHREKYHNIV
ncbi:hypothetical protein J6590_023676 [Homalodisca vitripennis]|nr:hypothetical protein J6590_023676 [Homalodisca vitripennis]